MALAQQGAEVVNLIVADKSTDNPQSATTIGQDMPEVKLHPRLAQIIAWPTMMHDSASPRIVICRTMVMIGMTSTMS
jgi:hypothetical protein